MKIAKKVKAMKVYASSTLHHLQFLHQLQFPV